MVPAAALPPVAVASTLTALADTLLTDANTLDMLASRDANEAEEAAASKLVALVLGTVGVVVRSAIALAKSVARAVGVAIFYLKAAKVAGL